MAEYELQKRSEPVSDWAKAVAAKIFDGTMPKGDITREQVVLDRLGLIKQL